MIDKIKQRPETIEAAGSNLGPNAKSRAAKCFRGTLATLPCVEGPTKKAESGPRI